MAGFPLRVGDWVALYTNGRNNLQALGQVVSLAGAGTEAVVEWGRRPRRTAGYDRLMGASKWNLAWKSGSYCVPLCAELLSQHHHRLWQLVSSKDLPALQVAYPECFEEVA